MVLLFAALAFSTMGEEAHGIGYWLGFAATQISVGAIVGVVTGGVLGKLVHHADGKGWIAHEFRNLTCIGVAILTLLLAHLVGGNGFIAAFVGGHGVWQFLQAPRRLFDKLCLRRRSAFQPDHFLLLWRRSVTCGAGAFHRILRSLRHVEPDDHPYGTDSFVSHRASPETAVNGFYWVVWTTRPCVHFVPVDSR